MDPSYVGGYGLPPPFDPVSAHLFAMQQARAADLAAKEAAAAKEAQSAADMKQRLVQQRIKMMQQAQRKPPAAAATTVTIKTVKPALVSAHATAGA